MYTVIFSKSADKDVISIVKHVAAKNPEAQPTRRYADTIPQPAAHFERNDVTIICETVH
jgi:plasmid stabilization system protein ParE